MYWANLVYNSQWKFRFLVFVVLPSSSKTQSSPRFCPFANTFLHNLIFICQKACSQFPNFQSFCSNVLPTLSLWSVNTTGFSSELTWKKLTFKELKKNAWHNLKKSRDEQVPITAMWSVILWLYFKGIEVDFMTTFRMKRKILLIQMKR